MRDPRRGAQTPSPAETSEEDGLHVHAIAGEQRVGLEAEEGTPGLLLARCGARWTGAAQNVRDRGGGNPLAKPSEFLVES
ncbi:hypothetical protein GCM10017744_003490 [Streptomyces antimycoticus]